MYRRVTEAELRAALKLADVYLYEAAVREYVRLAYGPEVHHVNVELRGESDDEGGTSVSIDSLYAYSTEDESLENWRGMEHIDGDPDDEDEENRDIPETLAAAIQGPEWQAVLLEHRTRYASYFSENTVSDVSLVSEILNDLQGEIPITGWNMPAKVMMHEASTPMPTFYVLEDE